MFSWRARRQLIAFLIIASIVGAAAFRFASRFIPEASCFDRTQNQGEAEIDCGGPCGACELRNPKSISIFWARAAHASPGVFDAVALIENPNEALSSGRVEYEFTFFDGIGEIARRVGTTFIFPQERTYVIEANMRTSRTPIRIEFRILDVTWQVGDTRAPMLVVEGRTYEARPNGAQKRSVVEAMVVNTTHFDFRRMETSIVVFDPDGNVVGTNRIVNEGVRAGERVSVISLWPAEFAGTVAAIEVKPRVNLFARDAVIQPE